MTTTELLRLQLQYRKRCVLIFEKEEMKHDW